LKVLHKLFDKLEEIRQAMGSDKIFDVLKPDEKIEVVRYVVSLSELTGKGVLQKI